MNIAKVVVLFFLLTQFSYPSINEYFSTLAEYKGLGDRAYNQAQKHPDIRYTYNEGATSVEGLIVYLQSCLRHDEIDEKIVKEKFDLLKLKLIPLLSIINKEPKGIRRSNNSAPKIVDELNLIKIEDLLGLKSLWKEISHYFNKIHDERVRANEEDIKQLSRYKWKNKF